jgi:hypothetical protein
VNDPGEVFCWAYATLWWVIVLFFIVGVCALLSVVVAKATEEVVEIVRRIRK